MPATLRQISVVYVRSKSCCLVVVSGHLSVLSSVWKKRVRLARKRPHYPSEGNEEGALIVLACSSPMLILESDPPFFFLTRNIIECIVEPRYLA
jgi:hypothetical protein